MGQPNRTRPKIFNNQPGMLLARMRKHERVFLPLAVLPSTRSPWGSIPPIQRYLRRGSAMYFWLKSIACLWWVLFSYQRKSFFYSNYRRLEHSNLRARRTSPITGFLKRIASSWDRRMRDISRGGRGRLFYIDEGDFWTVRVNFGSAIKVKAVEVVNGKMVSMKK